jgi:hypothetical protein
VRQEEEAAAVAGAWAQQHGEEMSEGQRAEAWVLEPHWILGAYWNPTESPIGLFCSWVRQVAEKQMRRMRAGAGYNPDVKNGAWLGG